MTDSRSNVTRPDDYVAWPHPSPVLDALGSLRRHPTEPRQAGFRVADTHVNGRGFLHAGVIATFADVTIGHTLAGLTEPPGRYVTVDLHCELLGAAALDDWVDIVVTPHKVGGRLAAGAATFSSGEHLIATGTALFVPAGQTGSAARMGRSGNG